MVSSMIASLIAYFVMEQFEVDPMYKAVAYGLVGLNSPEIINGVLKISGQFAADPMSFMKKETPKPKKNDPYESARSETLAPHHGQNKSRALPCRSFSAMTFVELSSSAGIC
jgi:hypothetical protein